MNKAVFFLCLMSSLTYGQKFSVSPEGFKNADDLNKSFVVLNIEDKTAKQLFDDSVKYITKTYENPDKVIKGKLDNEYLKFVTHANDFIVIKNSFAKVPISTDYTIELSFKDGKVKYEIISIDMYDKSGRYKLQFKGEGALSGYYIYNMKNELKKPEAKTELENYFNFKIDQIQKALKSTSDSNW